jgi:carbonic anhydrase
MADLTHLIAQNRAWAAERTRRDGEFFRRLARQQAPKYMWIGCSDSRVPANEIVGLEPGEMFVHRNIANVVVHADLNCLSVLQYAVEVLGVGDIIVCGHYSCGGLRAALGNDRLGLADNWLRHVQDVRWKHLAELELLPPEAQQDRLAELNVAEQALNVARTTVVREAWQRGQRLAVHGWIYDVADGLIRDLGVTRTADPDVAPAEPSRTPPPPRTRVS